MVFSWRRLRERATAVLHLDEEPSRLAAGMAVGVFIGVTPFYGLHTLLALIAAYVFRLNKVATITGAWLNLPWFAPFVYGFCFRLGEAVLTGDWSSFSVASIYGFAAYLRASPPETAGTAYEALRNILFVAYEALWNMLFVASKPLFVGTTIVGLVLAVAAYFITLEAVRDVRRLRARIHPIHGPSERPPRGTERTP